jgi:hypothetical protein
VDGEYMHAALCPVAEQQQADGVLDRLATDNDRLLAKLDEVIDVEAGLQQILDRGKEA